MRGPADRISWFLAKIFSPLLQFIWFILAGVWFFGETEESTASASTDNHHVASFDAEALSTTRQRYGCLKSCSANIRKRLHYLGSWYWRVGSYGSWTTANVFRWSQNFLQTQKRVSNGAVGWRQFLQMRSCMISNICAHYASHFQCYMCDTSMIFQLSQTVRMNCCGISTSEIAYVKRSSVNGKSDSGILPFLICSISMGKDRKSCKKNIIIHLVPSTFKHAKDWLYKRKGMKRKRAAQEAENTANENKKAFVFARSQR